MQSNFRLDWLRGFGGPEKQCDPGRPCEIWTINMAPIDQQRTGHAILSRQLSGFFTRRVIVPYRKSVQYLTTFQTFVISIGLATSRQVEKGDGMVLCGAALNRSNLSVPVLFVGVQVGA
jgi:hypothetical protein